MAIPPPINIKTEDFIDLDNYKCNDEKIQIWLKSVFDKIKVSFGFECQSSLESLMKWYIDSLKTDVINIDITRNFSMKLEKHLFLFHRNFKRFNCISNDTYLEYMEDILAFYLDCEVKRFVNEKKRQKKNKQFMRSRILNFLNVYLLNHKSRYHHVIMKMQADVSSDEAKSCLDNIYRVIFSRKPHSKSDQAFCTAFILYERWKKTLPPDCWPTLEKLIKEWYGRHPSTIQTNSVWKEITSSNESFIQTIAQFGNNDKAVCDAYFKYVKSKSMDESVEMVNKDANPTEEPSTSGIGTIQVDSESEVENILKNCRNIEAVEVKNETAENDKNGDNTDDDDDCIIVSDDPMYINPEDVVLEILDDDDDEEDNSTGKEAGTNSSNKSNHELSFLDSIDITAKASTTPNDNPTIEPVFSASVKSQNSVEDEIVESIDILSEKITKKKDVEQELNITEEANNISEESNSPHSTFINSPLPTIMNKLYTSPTSPDISSTILVQDLAKETQNGVDQSHLLTNIEPETLSSEAESNECNEADVLEQATSIHIEDIESTEPSILYETVGNTDRVDSGVEQIGEMPDNSTVISSTILYTQKVDNLSVIEDVVLSTPAREQNQTTSSPTSSPSDFMSPTFEKGMDDFEGYLSNFQNASENDKLDEEKKESSRKRKRVFFSDVNTVHLVNTVDSVSPRDGHEPQAIPLDSEILNDQLYNSKPVVVVERLSKMEIDGWRNLSERTRKKQRFENTDCLKRLKQPEMNIYHVIYDKSNNNDQFFYKGAGDCNWRQTQEPKLIKKDGNIQLILDDSSSDICTNLCCGYISKYLDNLAISKDPSIPPTSSNPFYPDILQTSRITGFINQPAAIPDVEEFEKTLILEEVTKISPIPSDLSNINISKLSPSPILNCYSPHFSDYFTNDKLHSDYSSSSSSSINDSKELNIQESKITTFDEQNEIDDKKNSSEDGPQTRLPLKKRKHSVSNLNEFDDDEDFIGPELIEEIIKRARAEENETEEVISYPAKPAISIAEIQEQLVEPQSRSFKTPAQKKEMPPTAPVPSVPSIQLLPDQPGRDMNNGKFVGKRKLQKNTISQKNPEVRKRGRPRKKI